MKKIFLSILCLVIIVYYSQAQISSLNNNTISIHYSLKHQENNPFFPAVIGNTVDLINGVNYNNGAALSFTVSSPATYSIRIYAPESSYVPYGPTMGHMSDIRDYIFFSISENTTGGFVRIKNQNDGEALGNNEKTVISNCPATINPANPSTSQSKDFSLQFKIRPGYSVPPGSYYTRVVITATYE